MIRLHVVMAVFKRNVLSFFSSMLGYLFIIAFVLAGAFAAFDEEFFANNEASLDQLTEWYPVLLIFMVPAITMSMWSDEKKLGTDELLFTLPGSDWEILIGKYLAGLETYTIIVLFSFSHAIVLSWIGDPDWGVIFSTFIGYWVAGASMIAIGMFASVLTSSSTIAFVLGAMLCAIPVFIDELPGLDTLKILVNFREPLSIGGNLSYFALGMIPVNGMIYFLLLTMLFLYLNAVVVARRHWGGSPWGVSYGWQYAVRIISLSVVVISLSYIASKAVGARIDMTAEKLFTLTDTTLKTIERIDPKRPIQIDAFVTPDVPEEYLQVKKNLMGVLRQLDRKGGDKIRVRIVDTEPATREEEEARKWGIDPVTRDVEERGRRVTETIFLGAVIRSGYDEVVIPFFDKGTPVEYELARSIGTALKDQRLTVAILDTRANLIEDQLGLDGTRERNEWRIVEELRKQYVVKRVSADEPIEDAFDVLIAALPSSLTDTQLDNLTDYVKSGRPVLILDDAWPRNLPRLDLIPGYRDPQMGLMGFDKPGLTKLLKAIGVTWKKDEIVFDNFNPHPVYQDAFPSEFLFITSSGGNREEPGINQESPISSPFQELVFLYSGHIDRDPESNLDFEPLAKSRTKTTGTTNVNDWIVRDVFGRPQLNEPEHKVARLKNYILATRISSKDENGINAIYIADLEFISDAIFNVWEQQGIDFPIDNVMFLLNCVDSLAGNNDFLQLRGRYRQQRKLLKVEERREIFQRNLSKTIAEAQAEAEQKIKDARDRIEKELEKIDQDASLDSGAKEQKKRTVRASLSRLTEQEIARINRETNAKIRSERINAHEQIKHVENLVFWQAIIIPPLLPFAVGLMVLGLRLLAEQRGIQKERLVRR